MLTRKKQAKQVVVNSLKVYLSCAESVTPWEEIEKHLMRLPYPVLVALGYRMDRALGASYENGFIRGLRE